MFRLIIVLAWFLGFAPTPLYAQHSKLDALIGVWRVNLDGDARARAMRIYKAELSADGLTQLKASYGWENQRLQDVAVTATNSENGYTLIFTTPANSKLELSQKTNLLFEGKFTSAKGDIQLVKMTKDLSSPVEKIASSQRKVHLVYMGGDDCPPCVAWRRFELPTLQESTAFKASKFTYVKKTIHSPVPSAWFLPQEVKELKPILDIASGGGGGSPQFAVVVDGKVYDYYWGTRDSATTEKMLESILTGSKYPFPNRCIQYQAQPRICIQTVVSN